LKWEFSGKAQAQYFYNLVKDDLPEIGLVVDFEQTIKLLHPLQQKFYYVTSWKS
jgi:hypothetical protein